MKVGFNFTVPVPHRYTFGVCAKAPSGSKNIKNTKILRLRFVDFFVMMIIGLDGMIYFLFN